MIIRCFLIVLVACSAPLWVPALFFAAVAAFVLGGAAACAAAFVNLPFRGPKP